MVLCEPLSFNPAGSNERLTSLSLPRQATRSGQAIVKAANGVGVGRFLRLAQINDKNKRQIELRGDAVAQSRCNIS